jgi:hypothetical protein
MAVDYGRMRAQARQEAARQGSEPAGAEEARIGQLIGMGTLGAFGLAAGAATGGLQGAASGMSAGASAGGALGGGVGSAAGGGDGVTAAADMTRGALGAAGLGMDLKSAGEGPGNGLVGAADAGARIADTAENIEDISTPHSFRPEARSAAAGSFDILTSLLTPSSQQMMS